MNVNLSKISSIIFGLINREELSLQDVSKIQKLIREMNQILYHNPMLKFQMPYDCSTMDGLEGFRNEVKHILNLWSEFEALSTGNYVNKQFAEIYVFFKYVDAEVILEKVVSRFESLPVEIKEHFAYIQQKYPFISEKLDYKVKDYSLIKQHIDVMCKQVEDYKWLYDHLCDWRSKATLNEIIAYWFTFDLDRLWSLQENVFPEYWDLDLLSCDFDEVFVDCGAYIGDSALNFIEAYGTYKRIYCYELTPQIYKQLEENLQGADNVILKNKGVGNKKETIYIEDIVHAGNSISSKGSCPVELVALDDDINEPVTCIKMDIEGAEKDALRGARNHIINEKPKLLICTYHTPADIFDIPKLIMDMRDDYKLYLRYEGEPGRIWICDYVLYAL
ncbi:MAG: FkbM family methyltransferase [Clostridium sp.]|nr:FkbM family methyltransferase [Clostridium sp.]MCM1207426.1 FkbM family methyltransferase [Ruminococcus sp.]